MLLLRQSKTFFRPLISPHNILRLATTPITKFQLQPFSSSHSILLAGHNKWSKIRHKKAIEDLKKSRVAAKIAREIAAAVRACKGMNMDTNIRVRVALERAKNNNVSKTVIDNAIKSGMGTNHVEMEQVNYEGYGPNGVAVVVETLTDKRTRTVQFIRKIFERGGGQMGNSGSVAWNFELKGTITIKFNNPNTAELENQLIEFLMEEGLVDDFDAYYQGEEKQSNRELWLSLAPESIHTCKEAIETKLQQLNKSSQVVTIELDVLQIPKEDTMVEVSETSELATQIDSLIDELEDYDDVQRVFHNAKLV